MMNLKTLTYQEQDSVAHIGFGFYEKKSMTTLTVDTMEELKNVLNDIKDKARAKKLKGVLFYSHKPGVFLAGVDVNLINSLKTEVQATQGAEQGQLIYNMIEDLSLPTAACVDGVCLGGGLELALSCKRLYISDNSKTTLGLPEVMLGVLPGFGGTYRLPKRVGLQAALGMILTGKQIRGKAALKMGLADAILPTERMLELAQEMLFLPVSKRTSSALETVQSVALDNFLGRKILFQKAREEVMKNTKGFYPAPLKILETLESAYGKSRSAYLAKESNAFGELSQTVVSQNLQHIFFMTDQAKKVEDKDQLPSVERGAVLGAGVMGGGIAWLLADNDQAPLMKDMNPAGLELGLKQASENFSSQLKRKKITEDEFQRRMRSITPTLNYSEFKSVDLVIEAVVENMDVKKKVFAEVEGVTKSDCLLTTNTSSLSITEMSTALKNPERFAGLHFFNPVHKMPLVEIIAHPKASSKTIQTLYKWALDVKKTPIIVNDGPGFLVNRILAPYLNEAVFLLDEGVSLDDLDQAALNFGWPMGPGRLMDEIGLDVCEKVGKIMQQGLGARAHAHPMSKKMNELKFLGRKGSKGFYLYGPKGEVTGKNADVEALLPSQKKKMDETQIQLRLMLPMVNEAAYCLADKITQDPRTVDMGLVYGLGFPPFKGGLCKWADAEGLDRLTAMMETFAHEVHPERYRPAPFLKELVKNQKGFYS
jgi:3-hydroxyacyl-CoA dehydrogenase/enoyl-CoA hydratase/3-hydroxybutyryl-CoA epimerase